MIFEQTHFPQSGPSWSRIIIISIVLIGVSVIAYKAFVPVKIATKIKPEKDDVL